MPIAFTLYLQKKILKYWVFCFIIIPIRYVILAAFGSSGDAHLYQEDLWVSQIWVDEDFSSDATHPSRILQLTHLLFQLQSGVL
jgi:hypothetical protein